MRKFFESSVFKASFALAFMFTLIGSHTAQAAGPGAVNLGSASSFVILTKTGISTTGSTAITGDIGVSPISETAITGFSLNLPVGSAYSTSPVVTGKVYAPGYANPTASVLSTAVSDMQTAYTDGAGRTNPTTTELGAGNIGGLTITPGLYKWGTGVTIPSNVTLSGSANDVWIFQIAQTLTVSSGAKVILTGGAQASNVFWIVAGQTTIGTTAEMSGTILGQTAIVLNTGSRLNGRALAQTAVTLDASTVSIPSGSASVVSTPATITPPVTPVVQTTTTSSQTSVNPNASNQTSTLNTYNTPVVTQTTVTTPARVYQSGEMMPDLSGKATYQGGQNMPNLNGNQGQGVSATSASSFGQSVRLITTNLSQGNSSSHVNALQQFLVSQNKGSAAQALARTGTTNYFGPLTRAALAEFQASVGINPPLGNFGPITRAYIGGNY